MGQAVEIDRVDERVKRPLRPKLFAPSRPYDVAEGRRARVDGLLASARHALDQRQLFVLLPFAIIIGLVASLKASNAPDPLALTAVGAALVVALPFTWKSLTALRVLTVSGAFWLGFSLLVIHGAIFGTPMLHGSAYGTYDARVDAIVSVGEDGRRVIVSDIKPVAPARALVVKRARILIKAGPDMAPGDIIEGPIRFYAVPGPVLPGSYDSQFHAFFDGIGAFGAATKPVTLLRPGDPASPDRFIDTIRRTIGARIAAVLGEPSRGIARALITGDQTGVTQDARQMMATAGLAHVLSISGLHLTLVAGSVFFVLRLIFSLLGSLSPRISAKKLAAGGGIVASLAYFAISGGDIAALRSTVMIILVFGAVIFGRRALTMRNVAIAGLICVILDPANVFRPSFQLSFAAVIGLIGIYELIQHRPSAEKGVIAKVWGHFVGIATTSLIAGGATTLFSIYHFQQTSPLGIVGNLAALPLVGFVMMPAAMFSVLAMPFGAEAPFLWIMGWSVDRMLDVAATVAAWSGNINASPLLTPLALFIGLLALAWFCFFTNRYRLLGPALAVLAIIVFAVDRQPDVLIADTTQALAMRTDDGLKLISGKPTSFAVKVWQQTFKQTIPAGGPAITHCDTLGCISTSPLGFTLAITKNAAAFGEDCASADVVVTRLAAPAACRDQTTVIDGGDLARGGVEWLRWDAAAARFEVRPAITDINRPWRASQR